jgi:hypothetical protein
VRRGRLDVRDRLDARQVGEHALALAERLDVCVCELSRHRCEQEFRSLAVSHQVAHEPRVEIERSRLSISAFCRRSKILEGSGTQRRRGAGFQSSELLGWVGPQVELGGLNAGVAPAQGDLANITRRSERVHRAGVAKRVG